MSTTERTFYKIRRRPDGLWSNGGTNPSFTKKGKEWKHYGYLIRHLGLLRMGELHSKYADCEVVPLTVTTEEGEPVSMRTVLADEGVKRKAKNEADQAERSKREKERRRIEWKKLKNEFGS